ncbi:MAG: helix-hairpin-helix domain-containing protein [Saprospiraceae bacterium]|nr:helix-hairpin-helix domain-containing protein [Saprospiraceae bacterium]
MRQLKHPSVKTLFLTLFFAFSFSKIAFGQIDSLIYSYQDALENTVAANGEGSFDYDAEFQYLQDYIRKPLNINKATTAELEKLRLLSDKQIKAIIHHRTHYGKYMDLLELQTTLPLPLLRKLLPFIMVEGNFDDFQIPVRDWFRLGKNEAFIRYERRLERAKGYKQGNYLGDANRLYGRYRYTFGNRLSYGFTLEKDAGESFKKTGLDFYSAHFQITDAHKLFKIIILGDYSISLGQGLIHQNGFALNKSALVLSIEKDVPPVHFYASANEANFLRGIATRLKIGQNTEGVIFASHRRRDGNVLNRFAIDTTDADAVVSALQFSGLHRTQTELDDKNSVGLTTFGGSIQHTFRRFSLGFNAVFNQFNGILQPPQKPYNQTAFNGKQLLNFSTNYKKTYKNSHVFGETAVSDNGGFASLNGLLLGLDKRLFVSVLHRYFSPTYQALNAQPFAESNRTQDENGVYAGVEFKPFRPLSIECYADFWTYKWLKFGIDAPSNGREFFAKITYKRRNTEGYIQVKNKLKEENSTRLDTSKVNNLSTKIRQQIRLHYNHKISKNLELRNRIEWSMYNNQTDKSAGFMIYQDLIYRFKKYPLSITSRFALFDTKDYNSAIYAYENDVFHSFTVLPYYFRGSRFYLNLSYPILKNGYLDLRFARTYLANKEQIGSGLETIDGRRRTDIKCQLRVGF